MYEMKPEYYTGIAQIDEEHKKLFEIADEAYELYKNEFIPDKYDHIAKILNELRDYTKIHFQHEEEYMKSINYKGMFMQKVQHDQFCQKLDELDLEHLDENSEEVDNDPRAAYFKQVQFGVYVRMALILTLLGLAPEKI